jgi:hypothetical protein
MSPYHSSEVVCEPMSRLRLYRLRRSAWMTVAFATLGCALLATSADAQRRQNSGQNSSQSSGQSNGEWNGQGGRENSRDTIRAGETRDLKILPPTASPLPKENVCSTAYGAALAAVRANREAQLSGAHASSRLADVEMPGRWLLAADLVATAKKKQALKPERVCAEPVKRGGRILCERWETKAPAPSVPTELTIEKPTAAELASFKSLNDFVVARTSIPEIGNNGRYNWLVARVASDLRLYIGQPLHPALCNGAPQMLDFYKGELAPLEKRMSDVRLLPDNVRKLLAVRLDEVSKLTPESAPLVATADYVALITTLTRLVVGAEKAAPLAEENTPIKRLAAAKALLLYAEAAALATERDKAKLEEIARLEPTPTAVVAPPAAARQSAALLAPVLAALRLVEAGIYADLFVARYGKLDQSLYGVIHETRTAHGKSCTCAD